MPGSSADLIVDSVWLEDASQPGKPISQVAPGQSFLIVATIKNIGQVTASGYYVDVYYDSDYGRGGPDNITAGEVQTWYVGPLTAQASTHTTKWVADPDNQIAELNETNNQKDLAFTVGSQAHALIAYYDVTGAAPGAAVSLKADVQNTGGTAFPVGVQLWFYVTDPTGVGKYVGYADASGLAAGATQPYSYGWSIPASAATGSYSYEANLWLYSGGKYTQIFVFLEPAKSFTVSGGLSGQVIGYYDVTGASPGATVSLKADVQNTGSLAFPVGVQVWFYVTDPTGVGKYVGYADASGKPVGTSTYSYGWTVPSSPATGSYSYKADLWLYSAGKYTQIASFLTPAKAFTVSGGGQPSGQVTAYYDVTGAAPGATVSLKADVQNTGGTAFPVGVQVWFYVTDPAGKGVWVGYSDVSGLAAGASGTYSYSWSIPASAATGSYSYEANLWLYSGGKYTQISGFLTPAKAFTMSGGGYSIELLSYYDVSGAHPGGTVTFSVDVKNTGTSVLPSNAEVWFYVDGPGWQGSHWVGYTNIAGLAAGVTQTYSFRWTIPASARVGTYTYSAQAWYSGPYRVASDMPQPGRTFNIN